MIIADTREPKRVLDKLRSLAEKRSIKILFQALAYGDYIITTDKQTAVIERKQVFDFESSIKSGRLWNQLRGMKDYDADYFILLIEGYPMPVIKQLGYDRWVGTKIAILKFGFSIIETSNEFETALFLTKLHDKLSYGSNHDQLNRIRLLKKLDRSDLDEAIDILTGFTGIGRRKAEILLSELGSLQSILSADQSTLADLIGTREAKHMRRILTTDFRTRLETESES